MKKKSSMKLIGLAITSSLLLAATGCKKDNNDSNSGNATTTFKVTDAPIDDASVTGAFVTIADIKLDGKSLEGFSKTTIDLNAYRNGNTKTIGTFNLEGKTYNTITFVLDYETDQNGNTPGSYIETTGGVKHKLQSNSGTIDVNKNIVLEDNSSNTIVADFDLRKMVIHQSGGASDMYDFATSAELAGAIRVVKEDNSGTISGSLTDNVSGSGKVIAYAYKKGTFDRSTEMEAQGASGIYFKNAVSSSMVNGSGAYELHFLENGEYEIHFASYKDTNSDGEYELQGTLVVAATGGLDLANLSLAMNTTLTVNVTATTVLP